MTDETIASVPAPEEASSGAPERKHVPSNTCSGCDARWGGGAECHCGSCHHTFSGVTLFDAHRFIDDEHGGCRNPAEVTVLKRGTTVPVAVMEFRGGMWRGPKLPDEVLAKLRGGVS